MKTWLINVLNNHDSTTHLGNLNGAWIPLGERYYSDALKEFVNVVGETQVSELNEFRSLDESPE